MSEKPPGRDGGGGGRGRGRRRGGRGNRGRGGRSGNNDGEGKNNNTSEQKRNNRGGKGKGDGDGGDGQGRRRRNNKGGNNNNNSKAATDVPQKSDEERLREEQSQREKEEALALKKRLEEEKKALEAAMEARRKKLEELEKRVNEARESLSSLVNQTLQHKQSRIDLEPDSLAASRKSFQDNKKKLKTDLKKCTAFVKKVKSGTAWSMKPEEINRDVSTLNLSRYVEEVVAALLEAKLKLADLPAVVALSTAMHQRYPDFLSNLLPSLWSVINGKSTDDASKNRRLYVRLVTEFLLNGLLVETNKLVKLVGETTGGKDGSYMLTDANLIVAFGKAAGFEIFGKRPRSVKNSIDLIRLEAERSLQHSKLKSEATKGQPAGEGEQEQKAGESTTGEEHLKEPVVISKDLAEKALAAVEKVESVLHERAVSTETSDILCTHCLGAYQTLSSSLVSTHAKLLKLEKRCEQDRLLSGTLPEAREKGLADARKLMESLQKSVDTFSDVLDQPLPQLEVEKTEGDTNVTGTGVELWTKGGGEGDGGDFGPFDDEETRAFYCDIPDLLTTVPPGLLGISVEDIERRKTENLQKYGAGFEPVAEVEESDTTEDVGPSSEAQLEEEELLAESNPDDTAANEDENKDTPHYRLMVLLEQELPECSRREQLDEIAEKFCTNHGSSKNSRKRLSKTLFLVPRTRLDLLPYYSRMAAILDRVWSDISPSLVADLEQQFHGQAKFKKNQNLESRLKTARYIGELTKFRVAPPIVSLRCMKRCCDDFTGGNIDVACCLLESCGRYLYRVQHTNGRLTQLMDSMMRLSKAAHLDERYQSLLNAAFYTVKPPRNGPRKTAKVYPPLESYLRHLLMVRLENEQSSISFVSKQIARFPWNDPSKQCGALICRIMLKTSRRGRYKAVQAVAAVAASLRRQRPEVSIRLVDAVLEELRWAMENPQFRDQQRIISYSRLLGELYNFSLLSGQLVIQQLYHFINYGHEVPERLREASEKHEQNEVIDTETQLPVYNSAATAVPTIGEDEEMEDAPLNTTNESTAEQKPVAVSRFSKFDPRVPSVIDPPNSAFRVKLVCTLLESVAKTLVTRNNLPKMRGFLAAFQRYLFTKTSLPTEVEFSLLDTFDVVDSVWRKATRDFPGKGKRRDEGESNDEGLPRYASWLDAHNATIAVEEADHLLETRARTRIEALAGESTAESGEQIEVEDLLDDVYALNVEDEEEDSEEEDALSASAKGSVNEENFDGESGDEEDDGEMELSNYEESSDDESEDSNESEDLTEEEGGSDEDEFDEQAYMQQLEEEAFERELRRVTMEALEKGKVAARGATGGKVADNMPSGSQIIKKKPVDIANPPIMTLGGGHGISFQLLKKGNKGKVEAKEIMVPSDTNLARVATKQDDAAARERDMIKARVLQYEAESAESNHGGNVYLEQEKLQVIRNRPLSMEDIDRNFGTSGGNLRPNAPDRPRPTGSTAGRTGFSGRGGRGRGGRGSVSGRGLFGS